MPSVRIQRSINDARPSVITLSSASSLVGYTPSDAPKTVNAVPSVGPVVDEAAQLVVVCPIHRIHARRVGVEHFRASVSFVAAARDG